MEVCGVRRGPPSVDLSFFCAVLGNFLQGFLPWSTVWSSQRVRQRVVVLSQSGH